MNNRYESMSVSELVEEIIRLSRSGISSEINHELACITIVLEGRCFE